MSHWHFGMRGRDYWAVFSEDSEFGVHFDVRIQAEIVANVLNERDRLRAELANSYEYWEMRVADEQEETNTLRTELARVTATLDQAISKIGRLEELLAKNNS